MKRLRALFTRDYYQENMPTIICSNGNIEISDEDFDLLALFSRTVGQMVDDLGREDINNLPFPTTTTEIFELVMEYCHHHEADIVVRDGERVPIREYTDQELQEMRVEFSRNSDNQDERDRSYIEKIFGSGNPEDIQRLEDLLLFLNFMDIPPLIQLCCRIYAKDLRGIMQGFKSGDPAACEAIRKRYNIPNDTTEEQIAEIEASSSVEVAE